MLRSVRNTLFGASAVLAVGAINAQAQSAFRPNACEYGVSFPSPPTIGTVSGAGGTFVQANAISGETALRAECVAGTTSVEWAIEAARQLATADGLTGWTVALLSDNAIEMRGYKTVDGRPVTYVHRTYLGAFSILAVRVGSESRVFPTDAASRFLASVATYDVSNDELLAAAAAALSEGADGRSFELYLAAADRNSIAGTAMVGLLYATGRGVAKDMVESAYWARLAANAGNAPSQMMLGYAYATGDGVPLDDVLAYMWFNLAAGQTYEGAAAARDDVARLMTPRAIEDAQALTRNWLPDFGPFGRAAPVP